MGERLIQCNTLPLYEKSENSHKPQQPSKTKPGIDVMYSSNYHTTEKQEHRIPQGGAWENVKPFVVEPQLHFTQPSVANQINTVPPRIVDITLPPSLLTKKEKEDSEIHKMSNAKVPQKDD